MQNQLPATNLSPLSWTPAYERNFITLCVADKENFWLLTEKRLRKTQPVMHGDATEIGFPSFDTQHAYSVSSHTDCSFTLFAIAAPQLHPWCLPHTFQIPDWKLVEDTTCMRLDSLQCLVACVWLDSNESWTCGYGVVVFGRWTVSTETGVTWGGLTFGMIRIY